MCWRGKGVSTERASVNGQVAWGGGGGLAVICVSGVTGSSPQRDTRTSFLLNLRGKGPYCTSLTYNLKPNYFIFELTVWFNMIFFSSKQGCIKIIRFFWDPPTVYTVNYIPIIYLICCMLYYIQYIIRVHLQYTFQPWFQPWHPIYHAEYL